MRRRVARRRLPRQARPARRAACATIGAIAVLAIAGCGSSKDEPEPKRSPVAVAVTADPTTAPARATMIMVHAGGWAGHDARAQQLLMDTPGGLLLRRGWRVVSIDYREGTDGLRDVLDAVSSEIERKTSNGPLCLYGESSGAHLALVAAARSGRKIDCVIGLGTPAALERFERLAVDGARDQRIVAAQIHKFFGTTASELAPWDPVALAPKIDADVLLIREGDDTLIPPSQSKQFAAAHPATKIVTLDPGDPTDAEQRYMHGSLSAQGRATYEAAIASFAAEARGRHRR